MRRLLALVLVLSALLCCVSDARAVTGASNIQSFCNVSQDGSCQVTMVVTLHLEEAVSQLRFPIPKDARNVSLNGSSAPVRRSGGSTYIDLSRTLGSALGDFTINISYTLNNIISRNENDGLELTVPLLSGFAYPVEVFQFNVTLPGQIGEKPIFSSGYWLTSIESDLTFQVEGAAVTGQTIKQLKDRETLTMTLAVDENLFPQAAPEIRLDVALDDTAMLVCGILALVYWLVFLRCLPPRRIRRATAPDGLTAGEMGAALIGSGVELTGMVLSWAQMGYILIQLDNNGRVLLHKRMEMGNERSSYENKVFRNLFGKRHVVDGTGTQYALLCRKVAATSPNMTDLYLRHSGNPRLMRILAAGIGLFGGFSMGFAIAGGSALQWLLILLLSALGAAAAWLIQGLAMQLHLRRSLPIRMGLAAILLLLVLGLLAGEMGVALTVIATQLLFGLMTGYGGRRSQLGKQTMQQIVGLRRYLRTVSREEIQRLQKQNPEFYHTLAPYALALGVDQAFAKRFGPIRLPRCPYLTTGMDGHLTAAEWCRMLKKAADALDRRQKRLPLDQFLSLFRS